jgi:hypothetical protein
MPLKPITQKIISFSIVTIFTFSHLTAQNQITAKYLLKRADSLAITLASNARLGYIGSTNVDTTGKSSRWTFIYLSWDTSSIRNSKEYFLTGQNNQVTFDSLAPLPPGMGDLNNGCIDSDSAFSIADRSGGMNIRRRFPSCQISAFLVWDDLPTNLTRWWFQYKCSDSTRWISMNALNGIVVSVNKYLGSTEIKRFNLYQNFPNPFNPSTIITFNLASKSYISLKIVGITGQEVATLIDEELPPGHYSKLWNAINFPCGVYFYRLQSGLFAETKKLLLLK